MLILTAIAAVGFELGGVSEQELHVLVGDGATSLL